MPADLKCRQCGKPMCRDCERNLGPYCSSDCLAASQAKQGAKSKRPVPVDQMAEAGGKVIRLVKLAARIAVVVVVLLGAWLAYHWWLHPYAKVKWLHRAAASSPHANRLLVADERQVVAEVGGEFLAVNPASGALLWRADTGRANWRSVQYTSEGLFLFCEDEIQRRGTDGGERTRYQSKSPLRLVVANDAYAVVIEGKYIPYAKWLKAKIDAGEIKRFSAREDSEYDAMDGADKLPPVWENVALAAIDLATSKAGWRTPITPDETVEQFVLGEDCGVGIIAKKTGKELKFRLVARKLATGEALFQKDLKAPPLWGPVIENGQIVLSTLKQTFYLDLTGRVVKTENQVRGEPAGAGRQAVIKVQAGRDAAAAADDDEDGAGPGDRALVPTELGFAYVDPATGKQQWSFELSGGTTHYGGNGRYVFATGHATVEGGKGEGMAHITKLMGSEGSEAAYVASAGSVADFVFVGMDRQSGKHLWQRDQVTGQIVCNDQRLLVLQDTAQTSVMVRSAGGRGALTIHQLDARTGRLYYSRTLKDLALREERLVGNRLIALAFDREPSKDSRVRERGNCIGVVALRIK